MTAIFQLAFGILGIPILCGVESVACFLNGGFHKNGSSSRCLVLVGIQLDSSVKQMNVSPSLSYFDIHFFGIKFVLDP